MMEFTPQEDERLIISMEHNEDGVVLESPEGFDLIQSIDFFTPIVNDPYKFGEIAVSNALSDVYAMGGKPYSVMNIVCFPVKDMDINILRQILRGGFAKIKESGAILAGGHSVEDPEIKYGLSVTGIVKREHIATNGGVKQGDILLLTKPIGIGILATALKAKWEGYEKMEHEIYKWTSRLNNVGAEAIQRFGIKGATDVTGFGLGGHLLEMARASGVEIELWSSKIPILKGAKELASMGLVPVGSHLNKTFCKRFLKVGNNIDPILVDIIFDAQTSGGLILSVSPELKDEIKSYLEHRGEIAYEIGMARDFHGKYFLTIV